jgi:polar amino acid transport system ATP-binding protein/polar amino acid transport system permease protein
MRSFLYAAAAAAMAFGIAAGIDLTVKRGEVVVIMGPSGSGKSTLLRMIKHLEPLDWGEITVGGRHVGYQRAPGGGLRATGNLARARAEARIGMVFPHVNLFENLTALEKPDRGAKTVAGQRQWQSRGQPA